MLIGTSTLAGAVIGPNSNNPFDQSGIGAHQATFTNTGMQITINQTGTNAEGEPFVYPSIVNEKRPIMQFSDVHIQEMKDTLAKFLLPGGE